MVAVFNTLLVMEACPSRAVCLEAATWEEESLGPALGIKGKPALTALSLRVFLLPCSPGPLGTVCTHTGDT